MSAAAPASSTLVIFGAGGHGRVVADCAEAMRASGTGRWDAIVFLDKAFPGMTESGTWPVRGADDAIAGFPAATTDCFVGSGDNALRRRIQEDLSERGYRFARLVHPAATVAASASLGAGSLVMPGAVVNFGAAVAEGCIVNTAAVVEHDCTVGAWTHLAPGSILGGGAAVGRQAFIGIGARVLPAVSVCDGATVGAGATVTRSIAEPGVYAGTPARRLRS